MARKGGGARGKTGTALPKSAPRHAGAPRKGSAAWHEGKHAAMQAQGQRARAMHPPRLPPVRHGGFSCSHCGHGDWRLHRVATKEGVHHPALAFKGCAHCGTMHPTTHHVAKHEGEVVTVAKQVDTSDTAIQRQDGPSTVGHRTSCPRGGSAPCGAESDGRCTLCNAVVRDHEAVGKTTSASPLQVTAQRLRALADA